MSQELVRKVSLENRCNESLAFWFDEETGKGEIVHAFMVASGEDDNDWDFNVVTPEEAYQLMK